MSQRIADEIQNRRGLVLGLTLAELLLLLLFLLLIALSWRMTLLRQEAVTERSRAESLAGQMKANDAGLRSVEPLLVEIKKRGGLTSDTVQSLVAKLGRVEALEKEIADLQRSKSAIIAQYMGLKATAESSKKLEKFDEAIASAAEVDPKDPPAVLKRAIDVLKRLGTDTRTDQVKPLSEMSADASKLAALASERDKLKSVLEGLKRSGNGLTYPPCWKTPSGQPVYMFDITIRDDGLLVHDIAPAHAHMPEMKLVDNFARDSVISPASFQRATGSLFNWSKNQDCRFYVVVRDGTAPASKVQYKNSLSQIENNFYKLILSREAAAPREDRESPGKNSAVPMGGPLVLPPPRPVR